MKIKMLLKLNQNEVRKDDEKMKVKREIFLKLFFIKKFGIHWLVEFRLVKSFFKIVR